MRLFLFYPLTKAMAFMVRGGWFLRAHVVTVGPLFFAIGWREESPK